MGEYYNYVYLDPRKPGKFVFGKYQFDYEPFIIGTGKKHSYYTHMNEPTSKTNISIKINNIILSGLEPIILLLNKNTELCDAKVNEINMRKIIILNDKKEKILKISDIEKKNKKLLLESKKNKKLARHTNINGWSTLYTIQEPNNDIIKIVGRKNVMEKLNCSTHFFEKKEFNGYKIIDSIKFNFKGEKK